MAWQDDICDRCNTTHPLNEEGIRPCPKPPVQLREYEDSSNPYAGVGVSWNCSGGTRGFSGGGRIPKTPGWNPGHVAPTLGSLGLSEAQGKELGI
jgi:hypothetical protein